MELEEYMSNLFSIFSLKSYSATYQMTMHPADDYENWLYARIQLPS